MKQQLGAVRSSPFVSQKMAAVNGKPNQDLDYLRELIEAGKVVVTV